MENSETSAPTGKRSTKRTVSLTPGQTLEILQQSAANCQSAGFDVRLMPIYDGGTRMVAIVLMGVELIDGNLIAINGKEEK